MNEGRQKEFETIGEAALRLLQRLEARKVSGRQKGPDKILTFSSGEEGPDAERNGVHALQASGLQLPCPGDSGDRQGSVGCMVIDLDFVRFQSFSTRKAATHPDPDDALPADRAGREGSTLRAIERK